MFFGSDSLSALIDGARRILDGGLGAVQRRAELLALEVREQKLRVFQLLVAAAALGALAAVTLALLTVTLAVAFWDTARVEVLGGLSALYLGATLLLYRKMSRALREEKPFGGTLDQLRKDRECLNGKH